MESHLPPCFFHSTSLPCIFYRCFLRFFLGGSRWFLLVSDLPRISEKVLESFFAKSLLKNYGVCIKKKNTDSQSLAWFTWKYWDFSSLEPSPGYHELRFHVTGPRKFNSEFSPETWLLEYFSRFLLGPGIFRGKLLKLPGARNLCKGYDSLSNKAALKFLDLPVSSLGGLTARTEIWPRNEGQTVGCLTGWSTPAPPKIYSISSISLFLMVNSTSNQGENCEFLRHIHLGH